MTPILMAAMAEMTPADRLGRATGMFAAFNTAGLFLAPLLAGWSTRWSWRLVFFLVAAVSLGLALFYQAWFRRHPEAQGRREAGLGFGRALRALWDRRMILLCAAGAAGYLSANGIGFVVALHVQQRWSVPLAQSGLILSLYGVAGIIFTPPAGLLVDRVGRIPAIVAGAAISALLLMLMPFSPSTLAFTALYIGSAAAMGLVWAGLNTMVLEAAPALRGGAASLFGSSKFFGNALVSVVYSPLYLAGGSSPVFWAAGVLALLVGLVGIGLARRGASTP